MTDFNFVKLKKKRVFWPLKVESDLKAVLSKILIFNNPSLHVRRVNSLYVFSCRAQNVQKARWVVDG